MSTFASSCYPSDRGLFSNWFSFQTTLISTASPTRREAAEKE